MKQLCLLLILLLCIGLLTAQDKIYLNGLNEVSYTYRTAQDSLNSYFRDAFSFSLGYRNFTLGMKFLAELPRYSTEQTQLMDELDANKLNLKWTERYIEFNKDDLLIHGGTIAESFGSGMVFRAWEDVQFEQDNRIDGFLLKVDKFYQIKALYGALPNRNTPSKYDLAYGVDGMIPLTESLKLGSSVLTLRTLTPLNSYNQQDVYGGRLLWNFGILDGSAEYARTSLYKNQSANHEGEAFVTETYLNLAPSWLKSLTLGSGYKYYDSFQYRLQDLPTMNHHNETLADNLVTGLDEEGLQGSLALAPADFIYITANYAEAWNSNFKKRMNDMYLSMELTVNKSSLLAEYSHIEKLDREIDTWQKELTPALHYSQPMGMYSLGLKGEYQYKEKDKQAVKSSHFEPLLQLEISRGNLSVTAAAESWWKAPEDILDALYWANCEVKYTWMKHTDITLFAGKEQGGKVCRNGICRYVAPFKGIRLELTTRF